VAAEAPLIPREVLFGNPERAAVQLSPDGQHISWLAPEQGRLNVWVAPVGKLAEARAVTHDRVRGVRNYFWGYTNRHIVYLQDRGGDENWRAYAVEVTSGAERDLTPLDGVQARIEAVSERIPGEIVIALNDRNPQFHDLYRVDVQTGERKLLEHNDRFAGYLLDRDYRVRLASRYLPDGGAETLRRNEQGEWEKFIEVGPEDSMTTNALSFDLSGDELYLLDSRGRDTAALFRMQLASGESQLVFADPRSDVGSVILHPTKRTIQAAASDYLRQEWKILDPEIRSDFEYLKTVEDGDIALASRTLDDRQWIVAYMLSDGPVKYYRYHRPTRKASYLFSNRSELEAQPLVKMHALQIPARDGLQMVSYLSLPPGSDADATGRPRQPVPMVLFVHGGPWARDRWGYHPYHQWLANRGYAVLSVNFRGSAGFGKRHLNAGELEWGAKMHDDLLDAVDWALAHKIADPARVAIMGGSYGGYATLVGLTFTPEKFAAGVDIVGPSNLITLLHSLPPYWGPIKVLFHKRMGNDGTPEGKAFLESRSPLFRVDRIRRPLLIGQGANDPRVKQAESDQIVQAMTSRKIPVTYVLFPDEGHGFARPENNKAFSAISEAFLARHLGGRYEPVGNDFAGSSVQVKAGVEGVPGLAAVLSTPPTPPSATP
jgi:dipeptidyl aminopeptidase/acylaminoacyl peptidase